MSSLVTAVLVGFVALKRAPLTALVGFAVMGIGIARVMPSGSIVRALLVSVAIIGSVASGLAAATDMLGGGGGWRGTLTLR